MVSFARIRSITTKGLRPRGGLRICTKTVRGKEGLSFKAKVDDRDERVRPH
jgi:hypothetical protein